MKLDASSEADVRELLQKAIATYGRLVGGVTVG